MLMPLETSRPADQEVEYCAVRSGCPLPPLRVKSLAGEEPPDRSSGWWAALDGYRNAVAELARQRAAFSGERGVRHGGHGSAVARDGWDTSR